MIGSCEYVCENIIIIINIITILVHLIKFGTNTLIAYCKDM